MRNNFDESVRLVLADEGGYTNDPQDPGGPTNFGITIFDYRKYIDPSGSAEDVREMTRNQAVKIYKEKYWDALGCDSLPSGVDYTCFDYGVNSGLGRPRACLRQFSNKSGDALIDAINDERMAFLRRLRTFPHFGRGWTRRVAGVRAKSHQMHAAVPTTTAVKEAVWNKSWTVPLSYTQAATAGGLAGIAGLNQVLESSQFKDVLSTISAPWWVFTGIAIIALLTYLAHGRKEGDDV